VRGTVELDGTAAEVDAPGWRDHSWGARRWDSFVSSRSFGGSHGEGDEALQFRFASMVGLNGSFFRFGSLTRAGQTLPVAGAEMLVHVDDDSVRCPSAEVRYRLEDGSATCVRIETIGGMIGATAQRYGWESVGDVLVDGKAGGWGFLETNLNARNGQSPPAFVLADGLTNGVVRAVTGT
jgi:predicted secreted hydrolase